MKVLIVLSVVVALSMARPSVLGLHGLGGLGVSPYLGGLGVSPHLGGLGVSPYLGGLGGLGGLNGLGGLGLPLASPISLSVASPLVAPKPVQDTPEVAQARAEHLAAVEKAAAAAAAAPEVPAPAVPAPQPVQDTPEVAQARAEHLAAVEIAAAAAAAAPEHPSSVLLPGLGGIHGGLAYSSLGSVSLGHLGAPIWARSNNIW